MTDSMRMIVVSPDRTGENLAFLLIAFAALGLPVLILAGTIS